MLTLGAGGSLIIIWPQATEQNLYARTVVSITAYVELEDQEEIDASRLWLVSRCQRSLAQYMYDQTTGPLFREGDKRGKGIQGWICEGELSAIGNIRPCCGLSTCSRFIGRSPMLRTRTIKWKEIWRATECFPIADLRGKDNKPCQTTLIHVQSQTASKLGSSKSKQPTFVQHVRTRRTMTGYLQVDMLRWPDSCAHVWLCRSTWTVHWSVVSHGSHVDSLFYMTATSVWPRDGTKTFTTVFVARLVCFDSGDKTF